MAEATEEGITDRDDTPARVAEFQRVAEERYASLSEVCGRFRRSIIVPLVAMMTAKTEKPDV